MTTPAPPATGIALPPLLAVALAAPADDPWARVLALIAADRAPTTLRAYAADLRALQAHVQVQAPGELPEPAHGGDLLAWLCRDGPQPAHARVMAWVAAMGAAHLGPATIARRMAALRTCIGTARKIGVLDWTLEITVTAPTPYRDLRGPGVDGVRALLDAAASQPSPFRERDAALIWLLFGRALRRSEAAGLDLADIDLANTRVRILGKHRRQREWVTIPPATCAAIATWLTVRGAAPGPLLWALDRASFGRRLAPHGIRAVIHRLGERAGLPASQARPHGLRHAAITAGLDSTGGDTRAVQRFARLRDANVIRHYDDNRIDLGGQVAGKIADDLLAADGGP